jgi:hypothetical protein
MSYESETCECALDLLSVYQTDSSVADSHAGQGLESLKCCYISAIRT